MKVKCKEKPWRIMNNNNNNKENQEDTDKILHFPELEKRNKIARGKEKEKEKKENEREKLEKEYRHRYRMSHNNTSGKKPFFNWQKIPPFSRIIVLTIIAVHLCITFFMDDAQRLVLYMNFGFVPAYYSGTIPWVWSAVIAPFTTAFIHGSWIHLLTNTVMMMAMGVFFERQFGARITLIFFIFCLMSGNLVYFILNPGSTTPVIGASGAISGLFGAMLLIINFSGLAGSQAQKRGPFPIIILWIAVMIGIGLISSDTAWQCHLGGFLGGIGLFQLWRKGKVRF